ncbi:MAG TPA: hypothetical protein VGG88_04245 [Gaiellaceae bacterium]
MRIPPSRGKGPLGIAAFIGIPLFFSSLMSASLAVEKPRVVQWRDGSVLHQVFHDPAASNELRIWLWALLPPLLLVLAGWVATHLPYGFYVACVAALVDAMAVVHKTSTWTAHHTARFPQGVDLIPTNSISNRYDPGEWEGQARQTALSLEHWTIGLALAAILAVAALSARRHYATKRAVDSGAPLEGVHAPDATPPGLG